MSNPKLPTDESLRLVAALRQRLDELGFRAEEALELGRLSAVLLEQEEARLSAARGDRKAGRGSDAVEALKPHPTVEEFRRALGGEEISHRLEFRIAHHLVGATCDRCQDALLAVGPPSADAEASSEPLIRALRRVAGSCSGGGLWRRFRLFMARWLRWAQPGARPGVVRTPMARFLVERWRQPLGFVRLLLEEALGAEVDDLLETVRRVAVTGIRFVPVARLRLLDRDLVDLVALTHAAMGEALRRAGRPRVAAVHASEAYQLVWGHSGPEVRAVVKAIRGRLDVDLGERRIGIEELEEAAELLAAEGFSERRAELLEEVAMLRGEAVAEEAC